MSLSSRCHSIIVAFLFFAGCAGSGSAPTGDGKADMAVCLSATCHGGCDTDKDCSGGQICDPTSMKCVNCLKDADCEFGRVCNLATHNCTDGCSANHGCAADAGQCEADAGKCVECLGDGDCVDPSKPRCDTVQNRCFPCNPVNDNCGYGLYCASQNGEYACVAGCKADPDCSPQVMTGDMAGCDPDAAMCGGDDAGVSDGGVPASQTPHCETMRHVCVKCLVDNDCPNGKICKGNTCTNGCTDQHACVGALACCDGQNGKACTDTTSDFDNCGSCGNQCQGGWNCCNSACANPLADVANCGSCGNACKVNHGTPACAQRNCVIAACDQGFADCAGGYLDGCETNIQNNKFNCGGCNNACQLPNVVNNNCVGGKCVVTKPQDCLQGFGDCNGKPDDGCETQVSGNPNNCGACGVACSNNNIAQVTCSNGFQPVCDGPCKLGFADCDMNKQANGCETNITNDAANCGACGKNCAQTCVGNVAGTSCANSACSVTACSPGFFDMDGACANGCECKSAPAVSTCQAPIQIAAIPAGGAPQTTAPANMVGGVTEAWYSVSFSDNANVAFHPLISIKNTNITGQANPVLFQFDVMSACGVSINGCKQENGNGAPVTAKTQWETFYSGLDPMQPRMMFAPIAPPGNNGALLIRVYRAGGAPATCDTFTLSISNG